MSRRRKKHKDHEEHMDESWLIPYADLLTLLLALFIVLFAMSSVDAVKFQQLSKAFNDIFSGGTGVFEFPSPNPEGDPTSTTREQKGLIGDDNGTGGLGEEERQELAEVQKRVNEYIEKNNLTTKLGTKLSGEGLLVTIRDNVLFESGSADVRSRDKAVALEIAELLVMDPPRSIVISGHTDNVPINTARYDSNWDLSVMRAVNFMKILLENPKLEPEWFSAKGYGEFSPVASNNTPSGKAKNRRVEILIMPRAEIINK
ncbi:flagellar motor protein MotB [Peribacillus acanthi]|uniref:flagellar motor protein MotB n=1 Tax=Peribacillus acanthi TaxID=2171554 RepID=UPI000D3ED82C|nr:flagellar motor protein MotB [Peribacillus acanthi]